MYARVYAAIYPITIGVDDGSVTSRHAVVCHLCRNAHLTSGGLSENAVLVLRNIVDVMSHQDLPLAASNPRDARDHHSSLAFILNGL